MILLEIKSRTAILSIRAPAVKAKRAARAAVRRPAMPMAET
jgi:hypothetical protein